MMATKWKKKYFLIKWKTIISHGNMLIFKNQKKKNLYTTHFHFIQVWIWGQILLKRGRMMRSWVHLVCGKKPIKKCTCLDILFHRFGITGQQFITLLIAHKLTFNIWNYMSISLGQPSHKLITQSRDIKVCNIEWQARSCWLFICFIMKLFVRHQYHVFYFFKFLRTFLSQIESRDLYIVTYFMKLLARLYKIACKTRPEPCYMRHHKHSAGKSSQDFCHQSLSGEGNHMAFYLQKVLPRSLNTLITSWKTTAFPSGVRCNPSHKNSVSCILDHRLI